MSNIIFIFNFAIIHAGDNLINKKIPVLIFFFFKSYLFSADAKSPSQTLFPFWDNIMSECL